MVFLGRDKEKQKIIKGLKQANNIILTGSYGIGRTTLIKNVAEILKDEWQFTFIDFSKTPGEMARELASALLGKKPRNSRETIAYKKARFLLVNEKLNDRRKPVIVLDNIARISKQKFAFIWHMAFEKKFQFIAITESHLLENNLFRLRSSLYPAEIVHLGYLGQKETIELFSLFSEIHGFKWNPSDINMLASANKGYPLGIMEIVNRRIRNKKAEGNVL